MPVSTKCGNTYKVIYHNSNVKLKAMEKLILKSIRLEETTLLMIDTIAKKHDYFTRSRIINAILHAVLQCSDDSVLWRIISSFEPEKSGYTVHFNVDREKLKHLPHVD